MAIIGIILFFILIICWARASSRGLANAADSLSTIAKKISAANAAHAATPPAKRQTLREACAEGWARGRARTKRS